MTGRRNAAGRIAVFALTPQAKAVRAALLNRARYSPDDGYWFAAEWPEVERVFECCDGMIFIMAAGIVVRKLAPLIRHKTADPAVVVIDQNGRYAISLLSGHIGGANQLAHTAADRLNAGGYACDPVITTGTDAADVTAFDVFAAQNDLIIENIADLKYISSAMIAGDLVQVAVDGRLSDCFSPPAVLRAFSNPAPVGDAFDGRVAVRVEDWAPGVPGVLVTAWRADALFEPSEAPQAPRLWLRPKQLYVGVGCRRGTDPVHLDAFFNAVFDALRLTPAAVAGVATIDIKADEPAIRQLADRLNCPLCVFSPAELLPCEDGLTVSDFVRQTVGVGAVSAPAAIRASDGGRLLLEKACRAGMTLSVAKKELCYRVC